MRVIEAHLDPRPDPKRWDLARLAQSGKTEDLDLARQGLGDWAEALDRMPVTPLKD